MCFGGTAPKRRGLANNKAWPLGRGAHFESCPAPQKGRIWALAGEGVAADAFTQQHPQTSPRSARLASRQMIGTATRAAAGSIQGT